MDKETFDMLLGQIEDMKEKLLEAEEKDNSERPSLFMKSDNLIKKNIEITPEFKESFLKGNTPYLKDGYLQFNQFSICKEGEMIKITLLFRDGTPLATMESTHVDLDAGDSLTCLLSDCTMKVKITDAR